MSVRHLMYQMLSGDVAVTALYGTRIIDEGDLGKTAGAIPEFPFLVAKYGEATRGASRTTKVQLVELWSYDHPTDYTRTDKGLEAIYNALHERGGDKAEVADEPTTHLVWCMWGSTSRGLTDDVLRASVRYATYTLVTNTP